MLTRYSCGELLITGPFTHVCTEDVMHPGRRTHGTRDHHDGHTGVTWPAAPRPSFRPNDGPRWDRPVSGFDMIGALDRPSADGTTPRALLLTLARTAADADPLDVNAAALADRFQTPGTPRLSHDETRAFAALADAHADPAHRDRLLSTLGHLSAVNGIPGTTCQGHDSNGDKCGRSNHHRGTCHH
ncbi:hypothetical protein [Streptomyces griseoaurantiacus]|uniref:hypothetical protein n=1 Tax=Streptomyces griseoaurantiacus TaxID=68213 RepID=UPI00368E9946